MISVTLQRFKENDVLEKKFIDAADPFLLALSAARDEFYANGYISQPMGQVLYDLMRDPISGSLEESTYLQAFPAIHKLFTRPATFEFYLEVFRAVWGQDVDVEFIIPSPGKLTINISALGIDFQPFIYRRIVDNAYVYASVQATLSTLDILFQIPKGLKTQAETDDLVRELNAAGVVIETDLVLDGFNPSKISGAKLCFEGWRSQTMTLSSGKLVEWRNRVSGGPALLQSVSERQPEYVPGQTPNSRGIVRFTEPCVMELGIGIERYLAPDEEHTFILVAKRTAAHPGGGGMVLLTLQQQTGEQAPYWMFRSGNFEFDAPAGWTNVQWTAAWPDSAFSKMLFDYNGDNSSHTDYRFYLDESLQTAASSSGAFGTGNVLGNYQATPDVTTLTYAMLADVAAIYFFDRRLTTEEMTDIYEYLDEQIGV